MEGREGRREGRREGGGEKRADIDIDIQVGEEKIVLKDRTVPK